MTLTNTPMESATLWVGEIEAWMDEPYIQRVFSTLAEVTNVKVVLACKKTKLSSLRS